MKFRTKENLSTAPQLTKNWTPKDLRHENTLQYTDNQATTKLILRAKEQQIKAATLLKDKDCNCITAGCACSAAYKGQHQAADIKKTFLQAAFSLARWTPQAETPLAAHLLQVGLYFLNISPISFGYPVWRQLGQRFPKHSTPTQYSTQSYSKELRTRLAYSQCSTKHMNYGAQGSAAQGWDYTALHPLAWTLQWDLWSL